MDGIQSGSDVAQALQSLLVPLGGAGEGGTPAGSTATGLPCGGDLPDRELWHDDCGTLDHEDDVLSALPASLVRRAEEAIAAAAAPLCRGDDEAARAAFHPDVADAIVKDSDTR